MDVEAIAVEGIWWRQTPRGGDPLFRARPPADGRWQSGEIVGALYFADREQTAWAQWYRALAEFAIPPDRQMPRDLWRWELDLCVFRDAYEIAGGSPVRPALTYRRPPAPPAGMTT